MVNSENTNDKTQKTDSKGTDATTETIARDLKEGRLSTFIGNGTSLDGELSFQAMAHIDGHLSGKITSEKGTLIVGTSGQVDAVVSVATGIIHGTINGDVIASEHLELKSTARIIGNIQTPRLIMEDGAVLEGRCSMQKVEEKPELRNARPNVAAAGATTGAASKSSFFPIGDSQSKDKKSSAELDDKESSDITLDVFK